MKVAIIGGGASGLIVATALQQYTKVTIFERGERLGRKLSATGNGQGNLTNRSVTDTAYFPLHDSARIAEMIERYEDTSFVEYLKQRGLLTITDERGRVYPSSRQASAITDALRLDYEGETQLSTKIIDIEKKGGIFTLIAEDGRRFTADIVVLCAGGKAAKNFGTDGFSYTLAQKFGHTLTPLYPSLVQLKTDTTYIKTLKGIRVMDAFVTARWQGGKKSLQGDIIFTDYGVSGDAIFRLSAFLTDKKQTELFIDFLPKISHVELCDAVCAKRNCREESELLCGILNNQLARVVMKRANGDIPLAVKLAKSFPLTVTGSLGFDYAQVTKGGIPLSETEDTLQSKKVQGLYFAGEILDVDGQCGGFNLQWAYSSARTVADAIIAKTRGYV